VSSLLEVELGCHHGEEEVAGFPLFPGAPVGPDAHLEQGSGVLVARHASELAELVVVVGSVFGDVLDEAAVDWLGWLVAASVGWGGV